MGFDDAARDTRGQLLRRVGEKEKQKKRTWKERVIALYGALVGRG